MVGFLYYLNGDEDVVEEAFYLQVCFDRNSFVLMVFDMRMIISISIIII